MLEFFVISDKFPVNYVFVQIKETQAETARQMKALDKRIGQPWGAMHRLLTISPTPYRTGVAGKLEKR